MSTPTIPSRLIAAQQYLARSYMPIPIPIRSKNPGEKGWPDWRFTEAMLPSHFGTEGNIGLLLGEPSGGLVDVDLDCPEALELAPQFLPDTPAKSGRPSAPNSHWWYIATDFTRTKQYRDPVSNEMILELRGTGSQTLVGPSMHPDGERYDLLRGDPALVDLDALNRAVVALFREVVRRRREERPPPAKQNPQKGRRTGDPHQSRRSNRSAILRRTSSTTTSSDSQIERRAAAYLDALPPAISGQDGHSVTYAAATAMVHGFGLSPNVALRMMCERYNPRCMPPWSEKELQHKVDDAAHKPHDLPFGWLRDAAPNSSCASGDHSQDQTPRGAPPENERPVQSDRLRNQESFPPHLLDVPGFIGEVIKYNLATAVRPQPILALAGAIGLQAALAARKVRDERNNRTNVYCIGVAPSGAGKDHARKVNKLVLLRAGLTHLEGNEDLASDAGLMAAVEEQPALLFQLDEFGRFLRTIGDPRKAPHLFNVLSALMKLYSSADTTYRGKAYADPKRNRTIDQPCVSLYCTTVPEHFLGSISSESLQDGFIARLLVFEADALPRRQRSCHLDLPATIIDAARWWGDFRPNGSHRGDHVEPVVVSYSDAARDVFDDLARHVDSQLASGSAVEQAMWARAEEQACRLALMHACSMTRPPSAIEAQSAQWACELVSYLTRRMLRLAEEWVADGQFDARQKRVLRCIRQAGGTISKRDLSRRTQWLTQRERQEVIDNLIETGQIEAISQATATKTRISFVAL